MRLLRRKKPPPSPRSDGTAELAQAREQRVVADELATANQVIGARIVERIEANHTAEALAALWSGMARAKPAPEPPPRPPAALRPPWRHA